MIDFGRVQQKLQVPGLVLSASVLHARIVRNIELIKSTSFRVHFLHSTGEIKYFSLSLSLFPGLMAFEDLRRRILATSGKTRQDVSEDDMARAIKKLRVLGGGFAVIPVGKTRLVQSVPGELNMDHAAVLQKAEVCMYVCCVCVNVKK